MIDWTSLLFNSLWIFGLALLLAHWSFTQYETSVNGVASQNSESPSATADGQSSDKATTATIVWIGLGLVGIGILGNSELVWERIVWAIYTIAVIANAIYSTYIQKR
jgi:hypothetical protein